MAKLTKDYNLAALYPDIAKEWHPTKNGDLTVDNVTPKSNKKVWWICSKGHEYESSVGMDPNNDSDAAEDNDGDGESDYKAAIRDKISDKEFLLLGQTYDRNGNPIGRKLQQDELREVQQYYRAYAKRKILSDENHADLLKRFEDKYNSVVDVGLPAPDEVIEGY